LLPWIYVLSVSFIFHSYFFCPFYSNTNSQFVSLPSLILLHIFCVWSFFGPVCISIFCPTNHASPWWSTVSRLLPINVAPVLHILSTIIPSPNRIYFKNLFPVLHNDLWEFHAELFCIMGNVWYRIKGFKKGIFLSTFTKFEMFHIPNVLEQ